MGNSGSNGKGSQSILAGKKSGWEVGQSLLTPMAGDLRKYLDGVRTPDRAGLPLSGETPKPEKPKEDIRPLHTGKRNARIGKSPDVQITVRIIKEKAKMDVTQPRT